MPEVWTPPPFDDISTSELVTAAYLNGLGNSLRFLKEVAYVEFTTNVSITATSAATANQVVSSGAITYENVPHLIQFHSAALQPDTGAASRRITLVLCDSTTVISEPSYVQTPATGTFLSPGVCSIRLTPTADSHTYNIRAFVNAGNGLVIATSPASPGFIRITRVPT
jgi:hypothetical protein